MILVDNQNLKNRLEGNQVLILLQVYNEIANIEQCVNSIKSQTASFTCLISDNHSNDGTREFLEYFVASNMENFFLITPKEHLNIHKHFPFICNFAQENFRKLPYKMIVGGDDYFETSTFLQELITRLEVNSNFDVAVPVYRLQDEVNSISKLIRIRIKSKKSRIRLFQLALYPTRLGNYNLVISLMKREAFDFWVSALISLLEKKDLTSRPKHSEILATFRLLQKHMVLLSGNTTYVKRIHNPNRSDRLISVDKKQASHFANLRQVVRKHWNSSISIFSMIKRFNKELNFSDHFFFSFLGIIAFISAWIDFIYVVLRRKFIN